LLQNLKPAGGFEPQFGQITSISSGEPHAPQNIESSGFSNWHFGHFIVDALQIDTYRKRLFEGNIEILRTPNRAEKPYWKQGWHILRGFSMSYLLD
jgi:hypothetical protein